MRGLGEWVNHLDVGRMSCLGRGSWLGDRVDCLVGWGWVLHDVTIFVVFILDVSKITKATSMKGGTSSTFSAPASETQWPRE